MYLSPEMKAIAKELDANSSRNPSLKAERKALLDKIPLDKVDIYAAGLVLFEMCGNFRTEFERSICLENLWNQRAFPKGFTDKYYQESKIIALMTDPVP